ncbi:UNVERIFIED_CONTAM: hypothetical protein Sradi_5881700 [Sesamum radiatum]|uniref:Integrase catalytic domain-containing protein n=1 Tax=Sesamum radiatum TaxID=300843 RepID=A0AAW2KRQ3_SESRA
MIDGELYKRGFSQPFLKCLTPEEGNYVLREIHEGMCENHLGGKALAGKSLRQGFYWPTMLGDAHELVKCCRACQKHANVNHQPAALMRPLESPCSFDQWDIRKGSVQVPLEEHRVPFRHSHAIISDNGTQFSGNKLKEWCKGLAIKQFFTSVSNPQANGQTEVTNRTILQHLKMRLGTAKGAWVDELPSVLWVYRTNPRTTTGETPFSLSYGTEAVAPAEVGEPNWRVKHYDLEANEQGLRMNLDFVEEVRERASVPAAMYKARIAKAYNSKVRPRNFQVGDLVCEKPKPLAP